MNNVLTSDLPDVALYNVVCSTYNINISELQSKVNIFNRLFKTKNVKVNSLNCRRYLSFIQQYLTVTRWIPTICTNFEILPTDTATC